MTTTTTKPTITEVLQFVFSASKEDRTRIAQAIGSCRNDDIMDAKMEFKVGDKVKFNPGKRNYPFVVYGVLTRKNVKTFNVRPEHGGREWKVTASMVQKDDRPAK